MRKVIALISGTAALVFALGVGPSARADSCRGDLYCDGVPSPCRDGDGDGVLECRSAGDTLIDIARP